MTSRGFGSLPPERQPEQALGQEQRDEDEQQAKAIEPVFGERAGEIGLGEIDGDRAERRADQRPAAADRDPDRRLDRIRRARIRSD